MKKEAIDTEAIYKGIFDMVRCISKGRVTSYGAFALIQKDDVNLTLFLRNARRGALARRFAQPSDDTRGRKPKHREKGCYVVKTGHL